LGIACWRFRCLLRITWKKPKNLKKAGPEQ
jgi:hypothetical protein